nr:MAG TPA: rubredoxin iron binding domains containing a [Bacteriophage sp.]
MTREEIVRGLRCSASCGEPLDCTGCPYLLEDKDEDGVRIQDCNADRIFENAADLLENDRSQILALQRELALRQAQLDCAAASAEKLRKQNEELRDAAALVTRLAGDAAEERRGQWNGEGDGYADGELVIDVWHCSNCDYRIDDGTDDPELLPKYCPGCGARMDGDSYGD